ncbi:MAG: type II secretion system protein [Sedimentisphaerales bacterium]|nr:type II secretion system protein [Sedimentisphaerales bacterium]
MNERNGWTLLELLVVIAIVALLVSISLPALHLARRQARTVICLSRLRQSGSAAVVWADENGGCTPPSSRRWQVDLRLHSPDKANEILFCPMATRFASEGARQPFAAYNAFSFGDSFSAAFGDGGGGLFLAPDTYCGYGSYGINGWVSNPPSQVKINARGGPVADHWRRMAVSRGDAVPLFLDARWVDGFPHHDDPPPGCVDADGPMAGPGAQGQMSVFCLDRHDGSVNGVFLDLAARKIGLKELWKLKWHRTYDTDAPVPEWPGWMKALREY